MNTINFDIVADLYDSYVSTQYDLPFFLKELKNTKGNILELMCGTGRISIPLLQNKIKLTCVDYSEGMLRVFKKKINGKSYDVRLIKMDVTELCLHDKYEIIFIPFNSFSEILSVDKQKSALRKIFEHLINHGRFIVTQHNPVVRIKSADGILKTLGKYKIENGTLIVKYFNQYNSRESMVNGFQLYEIFDDNNKLKDKRRLEINFRIIGKDEFEQMANEIGYKILKIYGDYDYSRYDKDKSNYIIYIFQKIV